MNAGTPPLDAADTIAAIATAPGEAGIAIVRVSGPESLAVADRVFRCADGSLPSALPAGCFRYGHVRDPGLPEERARIDEGILLVFRAPRSYTREDVAEFQVHGGRLCARRVLRAVLQAGARLAEPGEFTRRAFLNGRLDLVQAEAVMDLIRAHSDRAAAAAAEQLDGSLSGSLRTLYDDVIAAAADLEAALDFPEDELPPAPRAALLTRLDDLAHRLQALESTRGEGHLLREGARVAIVGRPNVGKSTLMNALLGRERSIVTDEPGTTRDTIEEELVLHGVPLRLIDTAGIRDSACRVEALGVERARKAGADADLTIYVLDASRDVAPEDLREIALCRAERTILALNKSDMPAPIDVGRLPPIARAACSALKRTGLAELQRAIADRLSIQADAPPHAVIAERHWQALRLAHGQVAEAARHLAVTAEDRTVLAAMCLREAAELLGGITGRTYARDLLDSVFSRFCIGK